jgi:hypothetical protein
MLLSVTLVTAREELLVTKYELARLLILLRKSFIDNLTMTAKN